MVQIWIHNSIFQIHKQNSFNILGLPSYEKDSVKSFINFLRAYELDQYKSSNIERVVKSYKQVLAYQQKQKKHFRIAKKEPQKIDKQNQTLN
jgi:alpha-mannosidase